MEGLKSAGIDYLESVNYNPDAQAWLSFNQVELPAMIDDDDRVYDMDVLEKRKGIRGRLKSSGWIKGNGDPAACRIKNGLMDMISHKVSGGEYKDIFRRASMSFRQNSFVIEVTGQNFSIPVVTLATRRDYENFLSKAPDPTFALGNAVCLSLSWAYVIKKGDKKRIAFARPLSIVVCCWEACEDGFSPDEALNAAMLHAVDPHIIERGYLPDGVILNNMTAVIGELVASKKMPLSDRHTSSYHFWLERFRQVPEFGHTLLQILGIQPVKHHVSTSSHNLTLAMLNFLNELLAKFGHNPEIVKIFLCATDFYDLHGKLAEYWPEKYGIKADTSLIDKRAIGAGIDFFKNVANNGCLACQVDVRSVTYVFSRDTGPKMESVQAFLHTNIHSGIAMLLHISHVTKRVFDLSRIKCFRIDVHQGKDICHVRVSW